MLVVGAILIGFGIQAANSTGSDFSRFFTGAPTNKSLWLLILGAGSAIAGLVVTMRPSR